MQSRGAVLGEIAGPTGVAWASEWPPWEGAAVATNYLHTYSENSTHTRTLKQLNQCS